MRCIEMILKSECSLQRYVINSNMRCIEMIKEAIKAGSDNDKQ